MTKESFQIGWYVLEDPTEFTNRGYECAAWHQTIMVPAGKYPVMAREYAYHERERRYMDKIKDNAIECGLTGEIVGSDFSAHFAGNRVSNKIGSDKGQQGECYLNPYAHALAKEMLGGKCERWELLPNFEAREIHFVGFDGEPRKTYGIFRKDGIAE